MQPTQKQIDDFLKNATEEQKRDILKYAKSEKVKQLAKKYVVDIYTYLINLK